MFANIGNLTSNVISSEKNLPLPISIAAFIFLKFCQCSRWHQNPSKIPVRTRTGNSIRKAASFVYFQLKSLTIPLKI